jgi:hypothetical protein
MFFGDSHTVGAGDPAALGWAGRVAAAAIGEGIPVTPYNLGVRGETSAEVAGRWRREALPRLPEEGEPRVVFAPSRRWPSRCGALRNRGVNWRREMALTPGPGVTRDGAPRPRSGLARLAALLAGRYCRSAQLAAASGGSAV